MIHRTVILETDCGENASIGFDTKIWAFSHVAADAEIGGSCTIGEGVHVGPRVKIGDRCKIQNGAQLFEGVHIYDDVFIGPHVVFTNVIAPRAFVNRKGKFLATHVGRGASIGANCTIVCGITIGEYAMIGAGSVVTRNVGPYELWYGNPATIEGVVCKCGSRISRQGFIVDRMSARTCGECR